MSRLLLIALAPIALILAGCQGAGTAVQSAGSTVETVQLSATQAVVVAEKTYQAIIPEAQKLLDQRIITGENARRVRTLYVTANAGLDRAHQALTDVDRAKAAAEAIAALTELATFTAGGK